MFLVFFLFFYGFATLFDKGSKIRTLSDSLCLYEFSSLFFNVDSHYITRSVFLFPEEKQCEQQSKIQWTSFQCSFLFFNAIVSVHFFSTSNIPLIWTFVKPKLYDIFRYFLYYLHFPGTIRMHFPPYPHINDILWVNLM